MKNSAYVLFLATLSIIFVTLALSAVASLIIFGFVEENILWIVLSVMSVLACTVIAYGFVKELMEVLEEYKD